MTKTNPKGAVAAGHSASAEAAAFALREGGNAFDAVVAAHWTACVAEPVLTHRVLTTFAAESEGVSSRDVVRRLVQEMDA